MSVKNWLDKKIIVFEYTFIDDLEYFQKPEDYFPISTEILALLENVKTAFRKNGWEGDGEIGLIWIPPFFYVSTPDKDPGQIYGTFVWHVKQHNNGISLGSLLALQNDRFFDPED
jgi:hypothetical protein